MDSNKSSMVERETFESIDAAERTIVTAETHIAQLRAIQLEALALIDRAQVPTADGARTLEEWVTARADVSPDTARDLVRTYRRTEDRPELRASLLEGEATFDRVSAASRMEGSDTDPLLRHLDVAGVRREAARRTVITQSDEERTFTDRFLVMQPSLDESWWRLFGGLDGLTGAIVDQALANAADQLPEDPAAPKNSSWRRATALAVLAAGDTQAPAQVTVFVDADQAHPSNGEAGVYVEAGPGLGLSALQAILCDAVTDVIGIAANGTALRYGRQIRSIPPALRRAVIHRDHNRCAIAGCGSRNRLQVHHIVPWSHGGPTDPENLITLCWFHHNVAVHQHGLTPTRDSDTGRWTLGRRDRSPPRT